MVWFSYTKKGVRRRRVILTGKQRLNVGRRPDQVRSPETEDCHKNRRVLLLSHA